MSTRELLIVLLVAALGLTGAAWFLATHEQVTEKSWTGYRDEARRNPWLAAQRFLERHDMTTRELRALPELRDLPEKAILIIPESHHTITDSLRDAVVNWVEAGGQLIVEGEYTSLDDPLVAAFGVLRLETDDEDYDSYMNEADSESAQEGNSSQPKYESFLLPGASNAATVAFETYMTLHSDDALFRLDGRLGTYLVAKHRGKGSVIVVNDLDYLKNNAIGLHDHAAFLLDMKHALSGADRRNPATGNSPVLFFNQPAKLSLFDWLQNHAWAPLSAGGVLLLVWLWRIIPRFGPVAPDPERARRRLLDHLRASGRFLWSNGHATRLLESAREACMRRIARALPDFQTATNETRATKLVHTLGLTQTQAQRILEPQRGTKMLQFIHTIRLYQDVYIRLAVHHQDSQPRKS